MKLVLDNLTPIGRELVLSNPEMFESEFSDGVDRGLSKAGMVEMMHGTFDSAADMELDYGGPVIKGKSLAAFGLFATYGWDAYVNGDLSLEDARALVRDNYRAPSDSGARQKASENRSSRSVKASRKTSSNCKGKKTNASSRKSVSRNSKPVYKVSQPRKANGQFAKKPRGNASRKSKVSKSGSKGAGR